MDSSKSPPSEDHVFLEFIENAPVGYYRTTSDGVILMANRSLVQMLGYSSFEELKKRNLEEEGFEPDYSREEFKRRIEEKGLIQGLEVTWTRADGSRVRFSENARVVRDAHNKPIYYEGFVEDITERQAALRQLRQSEQRYRQLVESLPHGLALLQHGQIVFLNPAAVDMLGGGTLSSFIGRPALDFLEGKERQVVNQKIQAALVDPTQWPVHYQTKALRKDGTSFPAEVYCTSVTWGESRALQLFIMDLTRMRRAEREREQLLSQLHQADKLTTVGQMAAGVAHEINNPIAFVLPNLKLLLDACSRRFKVACDAGDRQYFAEDQHLEDAEIVPMLEECLDGMQRIRDITRDLKQFSRTDAAQSEQVQLTDLLESTLKLAANEIRHRAKIRRDYAELPELPLNRVKMGQVLLNLLINAAQALDECEQSDKWISLSTRLEGGEALIEVANNGPPIPAELTEKIFDPFFTTKPPGQGSGLGLSISFSIVRQHGGRIEVESDEETGTRFRIYLPLPIHHRERLAPVEDTAPEIQGELNILVVDDEAGIRRVLKRMLRPHRIAEAGRGEEAIELLSQGQAFDLIICDLMMPGMDGPAVANWIHRNRPELDRKILFISGGTFTPQASGFLADTQQPCLDKPIDRLALLNTIKAITEGTKVG